MDMATLSNNLLDVFYMFIGLCMAITMVFTLKDKNHKTRIGTALFWGILAFIFIFARILPSVLVGCLVIVIAILSATKQINVGTLKQLDTTFTEMKAQKLGLKIFVPALSIAVIAMLVASFTEFPGTVAIGIASTLSLLLAFAITKAKPSEAVEDTKQNVPSNRSILYITTIISFFRCIIHCCWCW